MASKPESTLAAGEPGEAATEEATPQVQRITGAPLRAGFTDDNKDFDKFIEFLDGWGQRADLAGTVQKIDVRDRRSIRVVNGDGKPVPGARIQVVDEAADQLLLAATTYGDGRVPFYPRLMAEKPAALESPPATAAIASAAAPGGSALPGTGAAQGTTPKKRSLLVEVRHGDAAKRVPWDGEGGEFTVRIDVKNPVQEPLALDVLFLIDTTGSMSDEIGRIKDTLLEVTRRLRSLGMEFDLRYAAVLFRDLGDVYVTRAHPFTGDIGAFDAALRSVEAGGGGDEPESVNQGLAEAVGRAQWRESAAKVLFLIGDAPPHMDYAGDVPYGEALRAAVGRGIRIHAVAASGLSAIGTYVWRQIAQYTRGRFIFIEYGSTAQTAESHGVGGKTGSNNLDAIIYENIRDEIAQWGRE